MIPLVWLRVDSSAVSVRRGLCFTFPWCVRRMDTWHQHAIFSFRLPRALCRRSCLSFASACPSSFLSPAFAYPSAYQLVSRVTPFCHRSVEPVADSVDCPFITVSALPFFSHFALALPFSLTAMLLPSFGWYPPRFLPPVLVGLFVFVRSIRAHSSPRLPPSWASPLPFWSSHLCSSHRIPFRLPSPGVPASLFPSAVARLPLGSFTFCPLVSPVWVPCFSRAAFCSAPPFRLALAMALTPSIRCCCLTQPGLWFHCFLSPWCSFYPTRLALVSAAHLVAACLWLRSNHLACSPQVRFLQCCSGYLSFIPTLPLARFFRIMCLSSIRSLVVGALIFLD